MSEAPLKFQTPQEKYNYFTQKRMMDFLAVREHSEFELRAKLLRYLERVCRKRGVDFADEASMAEAAIDKAVQQAYLRKWLPDPSELSAQVAERLHRKNKGIEYINAYLEAKGLPEVEAKSELELEKALTLVKNKYSDFTSKSEEERDQAQHRVARFLASRGFSSEIVRKVIYEKFGN